MRVRVKSPANFGNVQSVVPQLCQHSAVKPSHGGSVLQVSIGSDVDLVALKLRFPNELDWPKSAYD